VLHRWQFLIGTLALAGCGAWLHGSKSLPAIKAEGIHNIGNPWEVIGDDAITTLDGKLQRVSILNGGEQWKQDTATLTPDGKPRPVRAWKNDVRWIIDAPDTFTFLASSEKLITAFAEKSKLDGVLRGEIQLIDPSTGRTVRRTLVTLSTEGTWAQSGGALYRTSEVGAERIDITSGTSLWNISRPYFDGSAPFGPTWTATPSSIWVPCNPARGARYDYQSLCGFKASTGEPIAEMPWFASNPVVSADGKSFALKFHNEVRMCDSTTGATVKSIMLPDNLDPLHVVVTNKWIAVVAANNSDNASAPTATRNELFVFDRFTGEIAWQHRSLDGHYTGYLGADGDLVVYFDSADNYFHLLRVTDRATTKIQRIQGFSVFGPDAKGRSSGVPAGAPRVTGNYIFIPHDEGTAGYRVR
jgi:hypothetical protein